MCGLIGIFNAAENAEPANETVLLQFEDQKTRGMQGFGIIKINDDLSVKIDRATEGYKFMWDIHHDPVKRMIVHHRMPTSTDNYLNQTHPILVSNGSLKYDYLVIHNGIITNDDELKEAHEKLGFVYSTAMKDEIYDNLTKFNDSESLAIELARFLENQTDKLDIRGSAAFIALQIEKKMNKANLLFFGRSGSSPLKMTKTRNKLFLSSEGPGNEIKEGILYTFKLDDEEMKLSKKYLRVPKEEEQKCSFSLKGKDADKFYSNGKLGYGGGMYPGSYDDDGYGLTRNDAYDLDLQEEFSEDIQVILEEFTTHAEWEKGMLEDDIKEYSRMVEERMVKFNKKMADEGFKESLGYSKGTFEEGKKISVHKLD